MAVVGASDRTCLGGDDVGESKQHCRREGRRIVQAGVFSSHYIGTLAKYSSRKAQYQSQWWGPHIDYPVIWVTDTSKLVFVLVGFGLGIYSSLASVNPNSHVH